MKANSFVHCMGRMFAVFAVVCCSLSLVAQTSGKQVRLYHVVVKTKTGTVRGILERTTPTRMYISARSGTYTVLEAADIRLVRVKEYPKRKRKIEVPVREPGLAAYTREGYLSTEYLENAPSLAEDVGYSIVGMAFISVYGLIYNGLNNLVVFKPKYDKANYQSLVPQLSEYAVYNQNLPDYEIELLRKKGNP